MKTLGSEIIQQLEKMLADLDFPRLYKEYTWRKDTYDKGFPDLIRLEKSTSLAAKRRDIKLNHLEEIAKWGDPRSAGRIWCEEPLKLTLYSDGRPVPGLLQDPVHAMVKTDSLVKGFGPTNSSKFLHFAVPEIFGALDSRLVRALGNSGCEYRILMLDAEKSNKRWQIPTGQPGWPDEFATWIGILHYLADRLNRNHKSCPHPEIYYKEGLREKGIWLPADVETALYSYASQQIDPVSNIFERSIGYTFRNKKILTGATTRRAYFNDAQSPNENCMEPLATLGDAVLSTIAIHRLYNKGVKNEGVLSAEKSNLVDRKRTRDFFHDHRLHQYIRWGKGEAGQKIWEQGDEAPDAVTEALIGAIFLDAQNCGENGLAIIREFLERKKFFRPDP